eukprot:Nitzschia sp. Nitz4//scaffold63_size106090//96980//99157//NITZ4_004416-RA/size106090-augustus-gene-0.168-mRNA-1//-1//CDS//3329556053//4961//frame0
MTNNNTSSAATPAPIVSEADVILPPPSVTNPLPSLPAALRLDNREQLLTLLTLDSTQRQLLVFQDDSLRQLLLRQVLQDPHVTKPGSNPKKNWEPRQHFSFPKPLNIVSTKLLHADSQKSADELSFPLSTHVDVVTYFMRHGPLQQTQLALQRIHQANAGVSSPRRASSSASTLPIHRLVYLPQPTALVQQLISDSNLANLSVHSLQLDIFPIEDDVLSLEYPTALKEAALEQVPSTLITTCARAILKLQDITGPIPRIQTLGPLGEEVLAKACHMAVDDYLGEAAVSDGPRVDTDGERPTKLPANHLAMMVLDRKVDMVTPMVTPLTYEGLLDQVVGIDAGFIQVPLQILQPEGEENPTDPTAPVILGVHAADSLYAEIRDHHVEKFGSFLQNQAKALQDSHASFTNKGTKKDLSEIHQFVKQIPIFTQNLRSLTNHIHLAEKIKAHTEQSAFREQWQTERSMIEGEICYDMLEEWICSGHSPDKVLRVLCLQSLCSGGLKAGRYDALRSLMVQTYGYEFLLRLHDLEVLGWIRRKDTLWMDSASAPFQMLRKSLALIHAEVDTVEPDDVAYVSSGYAPLTVRLVQSAVQGWTKSKADILKELPGRLVDIEQCLPPQDLATIVQMQSPPTGGSLGDYAKKLQGAHSRYKPTLLVFFCGGITYMEIAALRFLSKRPTFPFHIVMVTTKIVSGKSLLRQTLE